MKTIKDKNILFLSYIFPPHGSVGGRRAYFFTKYLSEQGANVSLITSENIPEKDWEWNMPKLHLVSEVKLKQVKYPKEYNVFQKLIAYLFFRLNKIALIRKIVYKISEITLPLNFSGRLDFNEKELSKKFTNTDLIIATGGPWVMFEYAYRLKKEMPNAKLLLDYRDPWISRTKVGRSGLTHKGLFHKLITKIHQKRELKFLNYSDAYISVSEAWLKNVQVLVKKPSKVIYNAFDKLEFSNKNNQSDNNPNTLTISYVGILCVEQKFNKLISAIDILKNNYSETYKNITINLIGSEITLSNIEKNQIKNHSNVFNVTPLISKDKTSEYYLDSDVFLQFSYENIFGFYSSKIYQYIMFQKPILLISNNNDVLEKLISKNKFGLIAKTPEDIAKAIDYLYESKKANNLSSIFDTDKNLTEYTFEYQTKELTDFIVNDVL